MHLVDGLSSGLGLGAGGMDDVETAILEAIGSKEDTDGGGNVVLVLDGLDFLLAATGCEVLGVLDMVGELREVGFLSLSLSLSLCLELQAPMRFAQLGAFAHKTARLQHDHCHSGRSAPFAIAHYASRNIPHVLRNELGAPGEVGHERKRARYGCGEGCQWCPEGQQRSWGLVG